MASLPTTSNSSALVPIAVEDEYEEDDVEISDDDDDNDYSIIEPGMLIPKCVNQAPSLGSLSSDLSLDADDYEEESAVDEETLRQIFRRDEEQEPDIPSDAPSTTQSTNICSILPSVPARSPARKRPGNDVAIKNNKKTKSQKRSAKARGGKVIQRRKIITSDNSDESPDSEEDDNEEGEKIHLRLSSLKRKKIKKRGERSCCSWQDI